MVEIYFCHRFPFTVVAAEMGLSLGTRADQIQSNRVTQTVEAGYSIDLLDNHFEDPDYQRLRGAIDTYDPAVVMLPDVYDMDDLTRVQSFGAEVADEFGVRPAVVPKDDSITDSDIPSDWLVGYPVPSGYGTTDVPITRFDEHDVHLLGGSHRNQIKYANRAVDAGVSVVSVDGNAFAKGANYGNLVNCPRELLDADGRLDGNAWDKDVDGYDEWGARICQSLARFRELWRLWEQRRDYPK